METRSAVRRTCLIGGGLLLLLAGLLLMWRLAYRPAEEHRAAAPSSPAVALPGLPTAPAPQDDPPASAGVGTPIDLSASYNAGMGHAVSMDTKEHPNNLGEFPTGEHEFAGVKFAVQGVIHLGSIYPKVVQGIPVGVRCQRLHLLHGTAGTTTEGAPCAVLTLHYADGSTAELPINYGEHLRDWWNWKAKEPTALDPGTEIAWWGDNDFARARKCRLRVYRSTFANPKPDQAIETIDYAKQTPRCNPFLLGLSIE